MYIRIIRFVFCVGILFCIYDMPSCIAGGPPPIPRLCSKPKAIIIAGGGPSSDTWENHIWTETCNMANVAYRSLLSRGYSDNEIYYINEVDQYISENDGQINIVDNNVVTLTAFYQILNFYACSWNPCGTDELLIYMAGHGGPEGYRINATEILDPTVLAGWMEEMTCSPPIKIIMESCYSGRFISALNENLDSNFSGIYISSSSDEDAVVAMDGKVSFSYMFWQSIALGKSISDAFSDGVDLVNWYQSPQLNANGNDVFNESEDFDIGGAIHIKSGLPSIPSPPSPAFDFVWIENEIGEEIHIKAIKSIDYADLNVFALILPPCYKKSFSGVPMTNPDQMVLNNQGNGFYGAILPVLSRGVYQFKVYATMDSVNETFISEPWKLDFRQDNGIYFCKGDVNGDGFVDIRDAIIALQVVAGEIFTDSTKIYNDVVLQENDRIGLIEAIFALQSIAGLR